MASTFTLPPGCRRGWWVQSNCTSVNEMTRNDCGGGKMTSFRNDRGYQVSSVLSGKAMINGGGTVENARVVDIGGSTVSEHIFRYIPRCMMLPLSPPIYSETVSNSSRLSLNSYAKAIPFLEITS